MEALVAPVLQAYVPPPEAVSVVAWPLQMVLVPEIAAAGDGLTVTTVEAELVHPPTVTV
jgi:hypothetical protein